jgi:biotin carboxyl carrier protein
MKIDFSAGISREVALGEKSAAIDGRPVAAVVVVRPWPAGDAVAAVAAVEIGGISVPVRAVREGDRVFVWCGGSAYEFRSPQPGRSATARRKAGDPAADLLSPMPGRVRKVLVGEGDAVARGDVLLILEAMKMEHAIRSPRDGYVAKLAFREGDLVDAGVPLAEIRAMGEASS